MDFFGHMALSLLGAVAGFAAFLGVLTWIASTQWVAEYWVYVAVMYVSFGYVMERGRNFFLQERLKHESDF